MNLKQWQAGGEYINTSQGNIFLRTQGQGPVLLLVHGFPTSSWDWHRIVEHLESQFTIISLDMLGFGFSDKPKERTYSTPLQVSLIQEVLGQKSIESIHVMTYSYGVSVVQEMLRQQHTGDFRPRIESACFMNGGLFPDSNHPKLVQKLLLGPLGSVFVRLFSKGSLARNLKSIFGPNTQPSQALIDQYWELINYNQGKVVLPRLIQYLRERRAYMHQWEQALRQASCPIQLIVGDQDAVSGLEVAVEFRSKISSENVHILEGIGHYPQLEAPAKVCELYAQFISSVA